METTIHTKGWLLAGVMAVKRETKVGTCSFILFQIFNQEKVLMLSGSPLNTDECGSEQMFLNSFLIIELSDLMIV